MSLAQDSANAKAHARGVRELIEEELRTMLQRVYVMSEVLEAQGEFYASWACSEAASALDMAVDYVHDTRRGG